jgi:hypothetical protein
MNKGHDSQCYVGIHNEIDGAMTYTAKIIRDAWVFGIIEESEACEGAFPGDRGSLDEGKPGVGKIRLSGAQSPRRVAGAFYAYTIAVPDNSFSPSRG